MSWVKIDDQLHTNEKALDCSLAARGLWLMCLSWVGDKETDGSIPRSIVRLHGGERWQEYAAELVAAGLWDEADGGYEFHDYLEYNRSHDQLEQERRTTAARQGKFRESRRGRKVSNGVTNAVSTVPVTPAPVPVPVPVFVSVETNNPQTPTQDEPTGSLSDTAPSSVVRSEGKPDDLGLYVENVLSEADRTPGREHWRQCVADAMAHSKTPVRSPKAFAKTLIDLWTRDPASRPLPPAPVGSTPPLRETDHQKRVRLAKEASKREYDATIAALDARKLAFGDDASPGSLAAPDSTGRLLILPERLSA